MPLHYRGDRSAVYDPQRRTGLIGKVMGPDVDGQYLVCTDAAYDPETDVTTAEVQMVLHPEARLAAMQREQEGA